MTESHPTTGPFKRWKFFCLLSALVFLAWWWMMPKGFPIDHPRFWANIVCPLVGSLVSGIGFLLTRSERPSAGLACLPGLILGLVGGCVILFPWSMWSGLGAVALAMMLYFLVGYGVLLRKVGVGKGSWLVLAIFSAIGFAWARTQEAPPASTRPGQAVPEYATALTGIDTLRSYDFEHRSCRLSIQPLLQFESMSPDGFWTLFAPDFMPKEAPAYFIEPATRDAEGGSIHTWTVLPQPIASHLNSFTYFTFSARENIFIRFSPCPDEAIEVTTSDYPIGRPARAAYMDAAGIFHVVEARSGEKGPYRTLAEGPVGPAEDFSITLYAAEQAVFTIRLQDFLEQASQELSPSAGWGFPQHAIEFSLIDQDPPTAFIVFTLAGSSMGRGWDSVSHAAGVYQNRLSIDSE